MEYLLPKNAKKSVEDYFKNNPVFSIFNGPWTRLLKEHNNVLSPSEIFYHIFCLWDDIRENPNIAENKCEYFSEHFVEKIKELRPKTDDVDIEFASAVIMQSLCNFFHYTNNAFYIGLCPILRSQICKLKASYPQEIHDKIAYALRRVADLSEFTNLIVSYVEEDDKWYSVDILKIIESCDNTEDENNQSQEEKLTIQQLIILFEATLNISLNPTFLNQSALAKLISGVSGYKFESIRSKIASRIDYDNKYVKADALKVAALIKEIRPDLAEKIINNTKE